MPTRKVPARDSKELSHGRAMPPGGDGKFVPRGAYGEILHGRATPLEGDGKLMFRGASGEILHGRVTPLGGPPAELLRGWGKMRRQDPSSDISCCRTNVRGYVKLSQAAEAFHYNFRGKTVLDIGSSTGGFTKYTLDHGAKKVIAVEKGTNQMMAPLRFDPKVELHEKTNIFDFKLSNEIDTIVADVSFISLKPVLNHVRIRNADYLVMLKPQFEARPQDLNRGVVKNNTIRRRIIKDFEDWLKNNGYIIIKKHDNFLKGKTGNQERFYLLKITSKTIAN